MANFAGVPTGAGGKTATALPQTKLSQTVLPRTAQLLREKKPLRIVAFGDSISEVGRTENWYGGASAPENNWAQQLGVLLQRDFPESFVTTVNAGIGGQNSYEGLGRLDSLQSLNADLVLVEFGANDCVYHYLLPEETQLALATMAKEIKARFGADVLVMGTAGDNPGKSSFKHLDETIAATKAAAAEAEVPFVDMRAPLLAATADGARWGEFHLNDGDCHPNDAGHQVWADTVHLVLKRHLL